MRVSFRGLYALKALLHLAQAEPGALVKIREIAEDEEIPEKFLEAILLLLKSGRLVMSQRGREGGYRLRRPPAEITIGEIVRLVDGPLAPFGDAAELQQRIKTEPRHPGLFELFLDVRNAASDILDHTSLADVLARSRRSAARRGRRSESRS
jgi:Rrf2 family transcriptional regulator, cysteine metabolism repressor